MVSSNKISVVTVSYNMERYIEQTIRSVVNQDYSNIEYIVVDGASTDRTVEIARRYEDKISTLISEPDDSHFDAMQKGLSIATGDVLAWLNADDVYYPWTLSIVGV